MDDDLIKKAHGIDRNWKLYATIPGDVEIEWQDKFWINLRDTSQYRVILNLLNSPEYKHLKTEEKQA